MRTGARFRYHVRFHIGTKIEEGRVECSPCEGLYMRASHKGPEASSSIDDQTYKVNIRE